MWRFFASAVCIAAGPGRGISLAEALASKILGVEPGKDASYTGSEFRCLDGSGEALPIAAVNNEACDCADGSDEPGTGACAGQDKTLFFCANEGSVPRQLYASRVGDGVCDCCDGSDESVLASRRPSAQCANTCAEEGKLKTAQREERIASLRRALEKKEEYRQKALEQKAGKAADLEKLTADLPEMEKEVEAAKIAADEYEAEEEKKNEESKPADSPAEGGDASAGEEKPQVSEYSKWMDGAADAMGEKKEAQVSEYSKWMDGAADAVGDKDASKESAAPPKPEKRRRDSDDDESSSRKRNKRKTFTPVERYRAVKAKLEARKEEIGAMGGVMWQFEDSNLGYAGLVDQTISKRVGEFEYKIQFFKDAEQDSTNLGRWASFTGRRTAEFTGGTHCWGGDARKLNVVFHCGEKEEILHVFEPSRCVYEASMEHPGACDQEDLDKLTGGTTAAHPRDEL